MTTALTILAVAAGLFLLTPWLAVAFSAYCDAINRLINRRRKH